MNLKRRIKEELNRTLRREGVKVKPKEGTGPPCCCEQKYDPWADVWDCLSMGTEPEECCTGMIRTDDPSITMGEGVKVKPKEAAQEPCCCHKAYNSACDCNECVDGAHYSTKCC